MANDVRLTVLVRGNEAVVFLGDSPASNHRRVLHVGKVSAAVTLVGHAVDDDLVNVAMCRDGDGRDKKSKPEGGRGGIHLGKEGHGEDKDRSR